MRIPLRGRLATGMGMPAYAAFVVNALSAAPVGTQVVLLEIGLFGLAMSSLLHGGHDEK